MKKIPVILFLLISFFVKGQEEFNIAQKPLLGWNSFDSYAVYLHEKAAYENLEAFVSKLKPHGYEYFVIDAGWFGEFELVPGTLFPAEKHAKKVSIDEFGRLEPSKTYFPNGIKPIVEKAHQQGVKFGIHLMRGIPRIAVEHNTPVLGTKYFARDIADTTSICLWNQQNYGLDMNKPGAQEYYNSVYQKMADWGIDFVKVDDLIPYPKEIVAIGKAIFSTGRPMIYSLSPGGSTNLKDIVYYQNAHLIRITDDIWDNIESIDRSFDAMKVWQGRGYPGFWPDLDMIPFGQLQLMKPTEYKSLTNVNEELAGNGFNRWSKFNKAQMRTFITQRALFASPLIVGGDLPTLDDYSLELLTNSDMLACNQNGHPATLISEKGSIEIWTTAISDVQIKGWIGIFNRSGKSKKINISKEKLGLVTFYSEKKNKMERIVPNKFLLKNIWDNIDFPLGNDEITVTVRSQDVIFIYYSEDIN
jgi:hypothetical protein